MTIAANASKIQYNCDGVTKAFAFTFNCAATSEVQVILTDANDVETILTETTDYVVSATNNDFTNGGTVTTDSAYAAGNTITIMRNVGVTQESSFYESQPTLYGTFEDALDHLSRVDQQLNEKLSRAALLPKSATLSNLALPLPEGSKYIGWNPTGTALQNSSAPSQTTVGATNVKYLSNYASFAAALTAIGSTATTLVIDTTANVTTNTTTPATLHMRCERNGGFVVSGGVTLTVNGTIDAGDYQIFSGAGTKTLTLYPNASYARPEWFGTTNPMAQDTTLRSITGDVTLNIPTDFATIGAALDYLQHYWISEDATVTLSLDAGSHAYAGSISIKHPCGKQIKIIGATPVSTTIVSVGVVGGSVGAWTVPITVTSATGMSTGQYAIVRSATGSGDHASLNGCWVISNIAGNVVTVVNTNKQAAFPTCTATGGTFIALTTTLEMAASGIYALNCPLGEIENVALHGVSSGGIAAIGSGAYINIGDNVGVNGFAYGIYAGMNATIEGAVLVVSGASLHGIFAQSGSHIYGSSQTISNGNTMGGISANTGASIISYGAVACGNGADGIWACGNAMIYTYVATKTPSVANSNIGNGYFAQNGGEIKAEAATANWNTQYGYIALTGTINIAAATATYNSYGFVAGAGGHLVGAAPETSYNTNSGFYAYDNATIRLSGASKSTFNANGFFADSGSNIDATGARASDNTGGYGFYAKNGAFIDATSTTTGSNATLDYYTRYNGVILTDAAVGTPTMGSQPFTWPQTDPHDGGTSTLTITVSIILDRIITGDPGAARDWTLDTGANCETALANLGVNDSMDWTIINLNGANAITVVASAGHTVIGNMAVAPSTSASFRTRRTAANTFITYRVA